jgi:peptidoglycan hydrolase-like protein with peptidoglycan-binding domain
VAGPDGYRNGYIWQNGAYVAVNCDPFVPYAAPFGAWAGWNIVTQPDYVQYPVYATYPVETAVEVALQKLGLYTGPIDGNAASCAGAIEQYQMQNGMPVTGTITPELLTALGIQATFQ